MHHCEGQWLICIKSTSDRSYHRNHRKEEPGSTQASTASMQAVSSQSDCMHALMQSAVRSVNVQSSVSTPHPGQPIVLW
jgi:hypothetical protein